MTQHIIIANYGNESIALIQWCIEHGISKLTVVNIDTGWAAVNWHEQVRAGQLYAVKQGLQIVQLTAPASFAALVAERNSFPSKKFQWCAGFLKGLAINQYLDECDPQCQAIILLAKRRSASRLNQQLPPVIEASEYYNDRKIWHPLLELEVTARDALIRRAGFKVLPHPSLECSPCIHADESSLLQLHATDLAKTAVLEQQLNQYFYPDSSAAINTVIERLKHQPQPQPQPQPAAIHQQMFEMGCGAPWGCGE